MCEQTYSILLHLQTLYQGNPYMLTDRLERSKSDIKLLRQLYEFLASKIAYHTALKRVALYAIYTQTEEAIHRFYGTFTQQLLTHNVRKTQEYFYIFSDDARIDCRDPIFDHKILSVWPQHNQKPITTTQKYIVSLPQTHITPVETSTCSTYIE
jgi:hypothetical protein